MKNALLIFWLTCMAAISYGQSIPPAPTDKAVVYFTRTSSLGLAINFSYYDSIQFIGKFNGPKYLRYECAPGSHLFWAKAENRDFVKAELEAGKIYFIEVVPKMGALKAGVQLVPINPKDSKAMGKIFKLLEKRSSESFSSEELEADRKNDENVIDNGLEKYNEVQYSAKVTRLDKSMYYQD